MAEDIPKLIIEISGGAVHDIVADRPVSIWFVDHDVIEEGGSPEFFPVTVDSSEIDRRFGKMDEEE